MAAKLATLKHGGDRKSDQAVNLPLETQSDAAEKLNMGDGGGKAGDAQRTRFCGATELTPTLAELGVIKVRAERKSGELLAGMPNAKTGPKLMELGTAVVPNSTPTLAELGVTKTQSSRWQKLAAVPKGANQHAQNCAPSQKDAADLLNVGKRSAVRTGQRRKSVYIIVHMWADTQKNIVLYSTTYRNYSVASSATISARSIPDTWVAHTGHIGERTLLIFLQS